jgi:hypothetical protein
MATTLKLRTDIKKLKGALSSKSLPAPIKAKLKAQLDKAQNELKAMQSGAKPRKVSTTKGTQTALTSLQKLVNKKKFSVYQGKGIDLKKDADQGALAVGRRVSKGLKGNQFGDAKSSKGNVYYEYRANRLDVKQPKGKQKYPKLEDGGMMAKGGITREGNHLMHFEPYFEKNVQVASIDEDSKIIRPSSGYFNPNKIGKKSIAWAKRNGYKFMQDGKEFEDGGMMNEPKYDSAGFSREDDKRIKIYSGNKGKLNEIFNEYKNQKNELRANEVFDNEKMKGKSVFLFVNDDFYDQYVQDEDEESYADENFGFAKGGYMADGGETSDWDEKMKNAQKTLAFLKKEAENNPSPKMKKSVSNFEEYIKKLNQNKYAKGGKLEVGVYRVGKPTKIKPNFYEQKIVEIFDNGDISTASDYGRSLQDFKSQSYPIISVEQLNAQYKMAHGGKTQGYDDKEDERLGMEYGKMSSKDLNSTHARRDDAQFEERMARGGEIDVEDIKNKIYGLFKGYLGNFISEEELVNSIKRKLGTKYFRFFKGDPMVNDWRSIENSLKSRNNRDFLKENMEISLEEKSLEIYNSKNEKLEKGGYMANGGVTEKEVVESNAEMVLSKIKEVHHHADELGDIVSKKSDIEAWVVAKIERASTDLSDITHYLDGQHEKMSMGGSINNYVHKMDKK